MKAADVMVRDVITVKPDNSVQDVAGLLIEHRISGVPVLDDRGKLVGIVSEGDLIRRAESGTTRRRSWWLELLTGSDALADEFVKTNSLKVADVMTRDVVTANPDTSLGEIATLLETNRIKRVPIVEGGKLVGILSRANLVQALASLRTKVESTGAPDDEQLRETIIARLKAEPWHPWLLNVTVHDGTVDLWGVVDSPAKKKATRIAVEGTAGVRAVNDNLVVHSGTWGAA